MTITKVENEKLGMHIKGGLQGQRGNPLDRTDEGVFVSKVNKEGAARRDGRLRAGMRLLEVNGKSLLGATHQEAVNTLRGCGDTIHMVVCKGYEKADVDTAVAEGRITRGGSVSSRSQSVSSLDVPLDEETQQQEHRMRNEIVQFEREEAEERLKLYDENYTRSGDDAESLSLVEAKATTPADKVLDVVRAVETLAYNSDVGQPPKSPGGPNSELKTTTVVMSKHTLAPQQTTDNKMVKNVSFKDEPQKNSVLQTSFDDESFDDESFADQLFDDESFADQLFDDEPQNQRNQEVLLINALISPRNIPKNVEETILQPPPQFETPKNLDDFSSGEKLVASKSLPRPRQPPPPVPLLITRPKSSVCDLQSNSQSPTDLSIKSVEGTSKAVQELYRKEDFVNRDIKIMKLLESEKVSNSVLETTRETRNVRDDYSEITTVHEKPLSKKEKPLNKKEKPLNEKEKPLVVKQPETHKVNVNLDPKKDVYYAAKILLNSDDDQDQELLHQPKTFIYSNPPIMSTSKTNVPQQTTNVPIKLQEDFYFNESSAKISTHSVEEQNMADIFSRDLSMDSLDPKVVVKRRQKQEEQEEQEEQEDQEDEEKEQKKENRLSKTLLDFIENDPIVNEDEVFFDFISPHNLPQLPKVPPPPPPKPTTKSLVEGVYDNQSYIQVLTDSAGEQRTSETFYKRVSFVDDNDKPPLSPISKTKMSVSDKKKFFENAMEESQKSTPKPDKVFSYLSVDEVERMRAEEERKIGNLTPSELGSIMDQSDDESESPPTRPQSTIGIVRTANAERRLKDKLRREGLLTDEEPESHLSPAEERALQTSKRAAWRQARLKSLEQDAIQAQMVIKSMNDMIREKDTLDTSSAVSPTTTQDELRTSSADFPTLEVRSKPGNTTVRESEKVVGERVTRRTEEYVDETTGETRVRTVEYVEKLIEREVETLQEKIISLELTKRPDTLDVVNGGNNGLNNNNNNNHQLTTSSATTTTNATANVAKGTTENENGKAGTHNDDDDDDRDREEEEEESVSEPVTPTIDEENSLEEPANSVTGNNAKKRRRKKHKRGKH